MYIQGKGYFDSAGNKIGSKRKIALIRAKICGYENDIDTFTRLIIESRVSLPLMKEQWRIGASARTSALVQP
jgi:hypothetical protein